MKQNKNKEIAIEQLKKTPIVQIACEKASISRATYYRWREEDAQFKKATDEAMAAGEALITDMTESQLVSLIRDRNFPAIQLWLKHHHPKYNNKVEVTGSLKLEEEPLTAEQQALVEQALKLAGLKIDQEVSQQNNA